MFERFCPKIPIIENSLDCGHFHKGSGGFFVPLHQRNQYIPAGSTPSCHSGANHLTPTEENWCKSRDSKPRSWFMRYNEV